MSAGRHSQIEIPKPKSQTPTSKGSAEAKSRFLMLRRESP